MASKTVIFALVLVSLNVVYAQRWRTLQVGVGDHCLPGAAPVGPGGSFQVVERGVKKVCAPGTSCRNGACNCDNLRDGTITGQSVDTNGNRSCKRVAGQRCSNNGDCFQDVQCIRGVCTCPTNKPDFYCVDQKNDIYILA